MSAAPAIRPRVGSRWHTFEAWVGTRSSAVALFALALAVFAIQSVVLPVHPGRDMARYVQTYLQLGYDEAVLPSVLNTRGPVSAVGVGLPVDLGGAASEIWLALLYAASILAWAAVAIRLGSRAAVVTAALLLAYPGYGILFHGLASDALFAAGFAGWAFALSRAILTPSVRAFLLAGAAMGLLVLVRPPNQVLIVFALLPLVLRAPWGRRLAWVAAFFIASAAVSQSWKAVAAWRYGDAVALRPTTAMLVVGLALLPFLFAPVWRRRLLVLALPAAVVLVVVKGLGTNDPVASAQKAIQAPPLSIFLFRAYQMDRIVRPENGEASRQLANVVEQELLTVEPYRSYGVDVAEFFSSGSDRIFADIQTLGGQADLEAVTREAIERHPGAFVGGITQTFWDLLWTTRMYASVGTGVAEDGSSGGDGDSETVVINGRRLPRPSEGQPIPASRVGPSVWTLGGSAREVWRSPTDHPLVFDDPRDERRYVKFEQETAELSGRIPTRAANAGFVHRLNQASRAFPPPVVWLVVGIVALALRRPRNALVAVAPAAGALVVVVAISLVALPVPEYAAPVSPAFILLTAAGLTGAHPRGLPQRLRRGG